MIIEIWAPEALVVLFLILPLCRPFIKTLWPLDGLIWLPLVSLGIMLGIFPAYGFRPECLPMLMYTALFNLIRLSRPSDSFRDRGPVLSIGTLLLLAVFAAPMFVFAPKAYPMPEAAETAKIVKIRKPAGKDYFVRIYGDADPDRPLIFIVPPEIGSAVSIDLVCTELQTKGFTVITYFHKGYDTPMMNEHGRKGLMSPSKLLAYGRIFWKAAVSASANEQGKALEAERRSDIVFLLPQFSALLHNSRNSNLPPMLLAGYGAGGSALAYLAGENGFVSSYPNVLGVAAIESRLWSSYLPEARAVPHTFSLTNRRTSSYSKTIYRQWQEIENRLSTLLPQQVSQTGRLPAPEIPLLYLVSGKALDIHKGQQPYQAVFNSLRSGSGALALAIIKEAGPLDYQDIPVTHPVCSFLLPGQKNTENSTEQMSADMWSAGLISDTASIIGNFASLLLEQAEWDLWIDTPPHQTITGSLYLESRGFPGFWL